MTANYKGRTFGFRDIDTKNITQEQLQNAVNETGKMVYERTRAWLSVNGIGYGWEII